MITQFDYIFNKIPTLRIKIIIFNFTILFFYGCLAHRPKTQLGFAFILI